jgi:hypothetical protein
MNHDIEYILEEGNEDIDLIEVDNNKKIIQVKYYGNIDESLTYNSGLFKVIKANYNKDDINEIIYYAYNETCNIYKYELFNIFSLKEYYKIGKYFLILIYNTIVNNDDNIKIDIREINNVDDYCIDYNKIKNKIYDNLEYKDIYDFFIKEDNCINYFSKFKLEKGLSYDDLNIKINNIIIDNYNLFINTKNKDNRELRITLIKNTILNILTDAMFQNNTISKRKILYNNIKQIIDKQIETYTDPNNLYYELLKQTEKIVIQSINNKVHRLNIELYINEIKKININSLDNISFYICLLNNYYCNLDKNEIKNIKNYIIQFMNSKYNFDNEIDNNFTFIKYLNLVINKSQKNWKIAHEKFLLLIDKNYKIENFFNKKSKK